jgi:tRNA modification GTPase
VAALEVSAETGYGLQQLLITIGKLLSELAGSIELDAPMLTQARHQHAVSYALRELEEFRRVWRDGAFPATVAAVHLHGAGDALRDLIGGIDTEQVLDEVFRRFCIGK